MTEERLAEWEQLFAEGIEDKTPVWLLGWAVVAKRGGNDLMAEVRRLHGALEEIARNAYATAETPALWAQAVLASDKTLVQLQAEWAEAEETP